MGAQDWIGVFNGDVCVGAKKWDCSSPPCELPVYGYNSLNSLTDGYMLSGELPSFKIYDTSNTILYDAIPSSNIVWQDGSFNQIEIHYPLANINEYFFYASGKHVGCTRRSWRSF